jgi:hypothetical protein
MAVPMAGIAQAKSAMPLKLSLKGQIQDIGGHVYSHVAERLVAAQVLGHELARDAHLFYEVHASIAGLSISGAAKIELSGHDEKGGFISLKATLDIVGMVPAESFPLGCSDECTSAIAAYYIAAGPTNIAVQGADDNENDGGSKATLMSFLLESAHLNPFGGPIVVLSAGPQENPDGKVVIVAKYHEAKIQWSDVKLVGSAEGTLGGNPIVASFSMTVQAQEDLFRGTEKELGTISLSLGSLSATGSFKGNSIIPRMPTDDCSPPELPGTCTITGFFSTGQFLAVGTQATIRGTYSLSWALPAVAFEGTAEASVLFK